jgi:hypothetical protein
MMVAAAVTIKNYFAPMTAMELDENATTRKGEEHETASQQEKWKERPPPIILTATVNR